MRKINVGSLLYIADASGKNRPHICVMGFKNEAGVVYDWLVIPITSLTTVGNDNLVEIEHHKLKKPSFAKINNMFTLSETDTENCEVSPKKFAKDMIERVIDKLHDIMIKRLK